MVTTANTSFDSEITQLTNHFGKTKDQVFDLLVLQAVQRLGRNLSEPITIASTGANYLTPGNPNIPASSAIRLGIDQD